MAQHMDIPNHFGLQRLRTKGYSVLCRPPWVGANPGPLQELLKDKWDGQQTTKKCRADGPPYSRGQPQLNKNQDLTIAAPLNYFNAL